MHVGTPLFPRFSFLLCSFTVQTRSGTLMTSTSNSEIEIFPVGSSKLEKSKGAELLDAGAPVWLPKWGSKIKARKIKLRKWKLEIVRRTSKEEKSTEAAKQQSFQMLFGAITTHRRIPLRCVYFTIFQMVFGHVFPIGSLSCNPAGPTLDEYIPKEGTMPITNSEAVRGNYQLPEAVRGNWP